MSITVSDARVESLALRRLLVGELPGCQYPVQYLRLLSRLCVLVVSSLCPRRVFKVSPHVVATSPSFSHSLSTLRQSRPECNSSFLTVSSMNHECAITVLPDHRQNFTPVLSPLHRSIIQTTKHIATPVSESPPRAAEALPRHHQPVVSVSRIPRLQPLLRSPFSPPCHQYISNVSPERVGRIPNSLPLCSPTPCQRGYRLASMSPTPR